MSSGDALRCPPWLVGAMVLGTVVANAGSAFADGLAPPPPPPPPPQQLPTSGFGYVDRSGMHEHVLRGAFEGLLVGSSVGYAISSGDGSSRVGTGAVLGLAAGIVLPLALNRGGKEVRSGDVVFINVAQDVGFAHGWFLPMLVQYSDGTTTLSRDERRLDLGLAAGISLAAGAVAAATSSQVDLTPGQASALGSAAFWGGAAGALLIGTLAPSGGGRHWDQAAIVAGVGLADAALLTVWASRSSFDLDRSRVDLMNLGGVAGLLVGVAAAYFIDPNLKNHRVVTASLLAGAGVGIASGFYLSDGWDEFKKSAPAPGTSGLSLLELQRGRWSVGVPLPRPMPMPMPMTMTMTGPRGDSRLRPLFSIADGRF